MATIKRPPLFKTETRLPRIGVVTLPPAMQERLCASDRPLALFPVRLETRFFAQPDGTSELRVRVYPDKVHLDSHEPELHARRTRLGPALLGARSGAPATTGRRSATAWRQLADRFGDARAAWIVRMLEPTNLQQRRSSPVAPGQPLPT